MDCRRHSGGVRTLVQRFLRCKGAAFKCSVRRSGDVRIPERTQADEVGGEETPVGTKQSEIDLYPII